MGEILIGHSVRKASAIGGRRQGVDMLLTKLRLLLLVVLLLLLLLLLKASFSTEFSAQK